LVRLLPAYTGPRWQVRPSRPAAPLGCLPRALAEALASAPAAGVAGTCVSATTFAAGFRTAPPRVRDSRVLPNSRVRWVAPSTLRIGSRRPQSSDEARYTLSGGITSHDAFFAAIANTLPCDPPVASSCSWDALSDSLWEGLRQLPQTRIVVMWPEAGDLQQREPQTLAVAVQVLEAVATTLADAKSTAGRPKDVMVLLGS